MLASLCFAGFAEQDELGRYRIGLELLRVAFEFHETRDAYDLVYPALDAVARRLGEPAFFAQLDGAEIVYSAVAEPPSAAFRSLARIGARRPAFCTALGKAILAFTLGDDAGAHEFVALHGPFERRTPNSIVTRASFAAELARVRAEGYATDFEEGDVGLNCVAFPIFLESRSIPAGAISVSAFASRTPPDALVASREEIREIVERHLGSVTAPGPATRLPGERAPRPREAARAPLPSARPASGPAETGAVVSVEPLAVSAGSHARVLVHLTTSEGLTGVGEASLPGQSEVVVACIRELARTIRGEDASRTAHLVRMLEGGAGGQPGAERAAAVTGIEQALWDVKSRSLGVPAYELLGGRAREWVELFASSAEGLARAELLEWSEAARADGFGALLVRPLRADETVTGSRLVAEVAGTVEAIRDRIGADCRLAVDLGGRLPSTTSLALSRAMEAADMWFIAGAVPPPGPRGQAHAPGGCRGRDRRGRDIPRSRHHAARPGRVRRHHACSPRCGGSGRARRIGRAAERAHPGHDDGLRAPRHGDAEHRRARVDGRGSALAREARARGAHRARRATRRRTRAGARDRSRPRRLPLPPVRAAPAADRATRRRLAGLTQPPADFQILNAGLGTPLAATRPLFQ